MSNSTVVLITGAGRGIGKGLVEAYLQRPNYTVIGCVRDSKSSNYDELKKTPAAEGSRLLLVSIDATSLEDPTRAVDEIQSAGITHVDIVIANAGVGPPPSSLETQPIKDITETYQVNVIAPLVLYQAVRPLLEKSTQPKWLSVSSAAGSITYLSKFKSHYIFPYGSSKAAMNYFTVSIHSSQPNFIAYAIHPGLVQTDMGNLGARMQGMEKAPVTIEDSCQNIMTSLDNATREETSGTFINLDNGETLPW